MNRLLIASMLMPVIPLTATAQTPSDRPTQTVFHPVESTGDLLTSRSRQFWVSVISGFQTVETINTLFLRHAADTPMRMVRLSMLGSTASRDTTDTVLTTIMPWLTPRTKPYYPTGGSALGLAP
ncbi:MAG: hypothetical protein LC104_14800 [Bacteroidales bacterium]|nr:hypothetical protein [Bacteroidales bacterium]